MIENQDQIRTALTELFSGYRAEWLAGEIFNLFTEPSYFPQLTTPHPCLLVGGRGTGKTTALRCLSYEGQLAVRGNGEKEVCDWPYYGMYYRVNTNRVNAFHGPEVPEDKWVHLFAHYINIEFCELIVRFLEWYAARCPTAERLSADALSRVSVALQLGEINTLGQLSRGLELSRLRFEAAINNIGDGDSLPLLSMQGAPIDQLVKELRHLPHFEGKAFFFLIDEYENLAPLQQRVINTLIKHCGELYSFKVGVKEFGLRERSTLNLAEQLMHPADYKLINITDELTDRFSDFASRVCDLRLQRALRDSPESIRVRTMLPELPPEKEAELLGVDADLAQTAQLAAASGSAHAVEWLRQLTPLEAFAVDCRARAEHKSVADKVAEIGDDPGKWREHYENYKHAYLFAIRRGKRGIRKYYCGWDVFSRLAAGNIRYILELVDSALTRHLDDGNEPTDAVSAATQTKAAQETGSKNLRELAGLALSGAKLTRLLLGLGRVFQVMAEDPVGHTPEVNQFHLAPQNGDALAEVHGLVNGLLTEAVMHLALLRYPASKLQEDSDVRQWDYAVHPIFAPFFGFSHRRKRKIELTDHDVWGFVETPRSAIVEVLGRQNRTAQGELPEQIQLFSDFYAVPD